MASIKNIFTPRTEEDGAFFYGIKKIISYKPRNIQLFEEAFTHRSKNEITSEGNQKIMNGWSFLEMQLLVQ